MNAEGWFILAAIVATPIAPCVAFVITTKSTKLWPMAGVVIAGVVIALLHPIPALYPIGVAWVAAFYMLGASVKLVLLLKQEAEEKDQ